MWIVARASERYPLLCEIRRLAATGGSGRHTLALHLGVLEEPVCGLGSRSARHLLTRVDLLALELPLHRADAYRWREAV
jgi:hypothetical protein